MEAVNKEITSQECATMVADSKNDVAEAWDVKDIKECHARGLAESSRSSMWVDTMIVKYGGQTKSRSYWREEMLLDMV